MPFIFIRKFKKSIDLANQFDIIIANPVLDIAQGGS